MAGPVREVEPTAHRFADDGAIPNNPTLPFLVYPGAVELAGAADPAAIFEELFAANGWGGSWRDGIFTFPHYHSNAHEVLGIACGSATVRFGGSTGIVLEVRAGDVAVLPAGTGHQNLGASGDLLVVGAYPHGQEDYDLCRGGPSERPRALDNIAHVPLPDADPVYGRPGPLVEQWAATS
jgi:uncharacterized protein YjlB